MGEILVIRHGETDFNVERRLQGSMDTELNENGVQQAYQAAEQLAGRDIQVIYSSPMKRAKKTAEIISESIGVPVIYREGLKEKSFGIMEGMTAGEIREQHGDIMADLRLYINQAAPEGESNQQVINRLEPILHEIGAQFPGQKILLVTHGAVARILFGMLAKPDPATYEAFQMDNCEVLRFQRNPEGKFQIGGF